MGRVFLMKNDAEKGAIPGKVSDRINLNRKSAYLGKVGRLREQYCIEQIRYMKACHQKISVDQRELVEARGETISCGKGCSACCRLYVEASLQECEAIVYYLYHNELVLNRFLERYPPWRKALEKNGDLFQRCERIFSAMLVYGASEQKEHAFEEALRLYRQQNIGCPFLHEDTCLIYEVRPSNCAGLFITTSPKQCNPLNSGDQKFNLTSIEEVLFDSSFYYGNLTRPCPVFLPVAVYGILEGSFSYLSHFPGLENLAAIPLNDPDVKKTTF
jgi:Fe-S-cluster containining protein